jgi:hypothetical protein
VGLAERCSQWTFGRCAAGLAGKLRQNGRQNRRLKYSTSINSRCLPRHISAKVRTYTGGFLGGAGGPEAGSTIVNTYTAYSGGATDKINGGSRLGNIQTSELT